MQDLEKELKEYVDILLNKSEGKIGRDYLKYRKILKNTAIEWEIGYCPVGYIPTFYGNEKYPFWEKLWGRIVFPIRNEHGEIISISGRKIVEIPEKEKNPKYDHYPFNARKTLFGLWKNQDNIFLENKAIITEGQLDVITAWQSGLKIVTSSFGAHCSESHYILLGRFTTNIFVLYDADEAGKKGLEQAKKILKNSNLNIRCKCPFNAGEDLDSWLQKHSITELYNLISRSKMDYLQSKLKKIRL